MPEVLIENQYQRFGVCPEVGASPTRWEINIEDVWHAVMRPTPSPFPEKSSSFSSFSLAPFSNRIPEGKFIFDGNPVQLIPNTPQGNAQHGDVRNRPWSVEVFGEKLFCNFSSRDFSDINWPWDFGMQVEYALEENKLLTTLRLSNLSDSPMPGGFGIHPYFVRNFLGAKDIRVNFSSKGCYSVDSSLIPHEGMGAIPASLNFQNPKTIADQAIDAVFGGYAGRAEMEWLDTPYRLQISSDPIFEHLVVFTAPDGSFALEPVSNATNGFNLMHNGISGHGVFVLAPQQTVSGTITMEVLK